jgi:hypothetical protein
VLWVVAGCLFEVSIPVSGGPWQWNNPSAAVTLLAEEDRDGQRHFRFRAEAPGEVALWFGGAGHTASQTVRIAPEKLA